jgi:hypothetical protein
MVSSSGDKYELYTAIALAVRKFAPHNGVEDNNDI